MSKDHQRSKANPSLQLSDQASKNTIHIRPKVIPSHFKWALILTITCFFLIGPCWALYKTFEVRRLIARKDLDDAQRLSTKISVMLIICTVLGIFIWVSILFCSVGLLITGVLLNKNFI